jgi:undecaprenyl-diphosphatase
MLASAIANGPAKWITRRQRPSGLLLKDLPRLGGRPRTSSFPSSHTASAAAFAVAASASLPLAAPVLGPLAASVALSRIRAVRHFPTDVAAGAVLGAGVGVAVHVVGRRGTGAPSLTPTEDGDA